MQNRMQEIAAMYGLMLEDVFDVDESGKITRGWCFHKYGLYNVKYDFWDSNEILRKILIGEAKILYKKYHPDIADWYWYVRYDGVISKSRWFNMTIDRMLYKVGNCYETDFEAKAHKDEWIEYYRIPY